MPVHATRGGGRIGPGWPAQHGARRTSLLRCRRRPRHRQWFQATLPLTGGNDRLAVTCTAH